MYLTLNSCKLETGSKQDKTDVIWVKTTADTDKTRGQLRLVRVDGENKLLKSPLSV